MRPVDIVLALIAEASSEKQKAIIRKAWDDDNTDFFVGLEMSSNPMYDFGIEDVPYIDQEEDGYEGDLTFEKFYDVAIKMCRRELEGQAARDALLGFAEDANITEWNQWYRRILLRTLPKILPMSVIKEALLELTSG